MAHDVELDAQGNVKGIRECPAGDRMISTTDPDMRHGRKSASQFIAGFKAQIVTTVLFGFIVMTRVFKANEHDGQNLPEIARELREQGIEPEWWGGDHAYGTITNHEIFQKEGHGELVARMARPTNGGRFTKDQFQYDFEAHTLTCPEGLTVLQERWETRDGKKGRLFDFTKKDCATCSRRKECVSPKAAPTQGRTVFIVDSEERLIRAHLEHRKESEFKERLAHRPAVERAIAGFAQCGGKKAHRFKIDKVAFDANLSALAYNLRRLGGLLKADPKLEEKLQRALRASTRCASRASTSLFFGVIRALQHALRRMTYFGMPDLRCQVLRAASIPCMIRR